MRRELARIAGLVERCKWTKGEGLRAFGDICRREGRPYKTPSKLNTLEKQRVDTLANGSYWRGLWIVLGLEEKPDWVRKRHDTPEHIEAHIKARREYAVTVRERAAIQEQIKAIKELGKEA